MIVTLSLQFFQRNKHYRLLIYSKNLTKDNKLHVLFRQIKTMGNAAIVMYRKAMSSRIQEPIHLQSPISISDNSSTYFSPYSPKTHKGKMLYISMATTHPIPHSILQFEKTSLGFS